MHVGQERVIAARSGELEDLHRSPRLPGRPADRFEEGFLVDQAGAGASQKDTARRDSLQGQPVHVAVFLEGQIDGLAVAGHFGGIEDHHVEAITRGQHIAKPGEDVVLREGDAHLIQVGVLLGQLEGALVEIDADDLLGFAERLGVDGEAAGVAAQVEDAFACTEAGKILAVVALIDEEAGLVLAAGRDAEAHAVLRDRERSRRLRRAAVERFLLAHVLFREPVELRFGEMLGENIEKNRRTRNIPAEKIRARCRAEATTTSPLSPSPPEKTKDSIATYPDSALGTQFGARWMRAKNRRRSLPPASRPQSQADAECQPGRPTH